MSVFVVWVFIVSFSCEYNYLTADGFISVLISFKSFCIGRAVVDTHFTPCGIKCASLVILFGMGGRHITEASYGLSTLIGKVIPK